MARVDGLSSGGMTPIPITRDYDAVVQALGGARTTAALLGHELYFKHLGDARFTVHCLRCGRFMTTWFDGKSFEHMDMIVDIECNRRFTPRFMHGEWRAT